MRLFMIILFIFSALIAKDLTIDAKYNIGFGLFGKIGTADMRVEVKDGKYKISSKASANGLAASLSRDRFELYESEGVVEDGVFIPHTYKTLVQNKSKYDKSVYDIYHDAKRVLRYRERINDENEKQISQEVVPYYGPDDLMSLFFNLSTRMEGAKDGESRKLIAVGGERKSGEVEIFYPAALEQTELRKKYKQDGKVIKVRINQPVFISESGELLLFLDNQGLCQKGVLEGLLIFGDVEGVITDKKIEE